MKHFRRDQPEHAVAEKFEALIRGCRIGAGVRQRALEQIAIPEDVAETRFQISR
jgi:hypothetical protein